MTWEQPKTIKTKDRNDKLTAYPIFSKNREASVSWPPVLCSVEDGQNWGRAPGKKSDYPKTN